MTETLWNAVIAGCVTIALAWIQSRAASKVAQKVEGVKEDLKAGDAVVAQELVTIRETGEKTHSIVNSERTQMLRFSAILARRVATLSGHADDDTVAKAAEELLRKNLDAQPKARTAGNVFHGQKE